MAEKFPALTHFLRQIAAGAILEEEERETITMIYPRTPASNQMMADIKRERAQLEKELGVDAAKGVIGERAEREFADGQTALAWLDQAVGILGRHLSDR